jgi:hypothetical protein
MKRVPKLVAVLAILAFAAVVSAGGVRMALKNSAVYHTPSTDAQVATCWTQGTPMGALPPAKPIWCVNPTGSGTATFQQGANSWVDNFDHGLTNSAEMGPGYKSYQFGSIYQSLHWRHNNHWMVDLQGTGPAQNAWDFGGVAMRPDRTFRFQNGALVLEADVAASIQDYAGNFWPEFVITTAPNPTSIRSNGTYVYEAFPNHWTLGCRLQADRGFTCALLDNTNGGDTTARVWELSHFQCSNSDGSTYSGGCNYKWGGHPSTPGLANVWRTCADTDPDTNCRDRFRWVIEKNRLRWYVNDVLYMEHRDFPANRQLPDALMNGNLYVYFGAFDFKSGAETVRVHWDRLAINASGAPTTPPPTATGTPSATATRTPTAAPTTTQTATATATASRTPTAAPTASATRTPTPTASVPPTGTQTVTFDDRTGQNQGLNGQYPANVIDWGTGQWFHSKPFGKFTTSSVSFSGGSLRSASFKFVTPRKLVKLDAYNGGSGSSTVTVSCDGKLPKTVTLAAGQMSTITTGWTVACTNVTVSASNGWDTNFDNMTIMSP